MSLKKRRLRSCRLFVSASFLFFLFLEKMVGIPMQKVSYFMFKVDVEIADICFVLPCLSGKRWLRWCHWEKAASYFFALCLPACVPYATSRYISVSVSLVYMHSGWYLTQQAHLYWKLSLVVHGGTCRIVFRILSLHLIIPIHWFRVLFTRFHFPWGPHPRSFIHTKYPACVLCSGNIV